jgi:FtsZ-binding cell division protein ZapB
MKPRDRYGSMNNLALTGSERLAKASALLKQGEYESSLREAEAVLETHTKTLGDDALVLVGLIYAHPDNPDKDYWKSLESFKRINQEYPESQINQSAAWFALLISETAKKDIWINELKKKQADLEKAVAQEQEKRKKLKRETKRLQEQTQALRDQLVKLKEIDLVIEQKKHEAQ